MSANENHYCMCITTETLSEEDKKACRPQGSIVEWREMEHRLRHHC